MISSSLSVLHAVVLTEQLLRTSSPRQTPIQKLAAAAAADSFGNVSPPATPMTMVTLDSAAQDWANTVVKHLRKSANDAYEAAIAHYQKTGSDLSRTDAHEAFVADVALTVSASVPNSVRISSSYIAGKECPQVFDMASRKRRDRLTQLLQDTGAYDAIARQEFKKEQQTRKKSDRYSNYIEAFRAEHPGLSFEEAETNYLMPIALRKYFRQVPRFVFQNPALASLTSLAHACEGLAMADRALEKKKEEYDEIERAAAIAIKAMAA